MEIEKIVAAIKEKGEERDTIIIFQSDNGAATHVNANYGKVKNLANGCNYPFKGEKTLLTEGGTLAPSIMYSVKNSLPIKTVQGR